MPEKEQSEGAPNTMNAQTPRMALLKLRTVATRTRMSSDNDTMNCERGERGGGARREETFYIRDGKERRSETE